MSSRLSIGATFPHAQLIGIVATIAGALVIALGAFAVVRASSGRRAGSL